jgi:hypothetical protein
MCKHAAQKLDGERFNLGKLNELQVRKQYEIQISNRFAALENLNDSDDINRAWESIKKNIKTSAKESLGLHELKQHKPWFHESKHQLLVYTDDANRKRKCYKGKRRSCGRV